ncbi:hypothetical protein [Hymenobacter cellulosilyticus]|uniref:STAS/SEC14 domain-containing protein n=1 Tax=Hymenobacter cellulosilyticus TaxID=2932248 RepID=A0A8T9Q7Y7_9BACT|nr:hypothetical protein [Hymenobacter cellulosilyticus]UOQ73677.1 hypothetical protein MUN79_07065 [Hymenobacter cellulosilyticus]
MTKPDSLFLHYDKGLRLLRWQWRGPIHAAQFQAAFYHLTEISEKEKVRRWLVDTTGMPVVGIDEQAWLSDTWLPLFARLQVTDIAIILPSSLHNQLVVETVLADGQRYDCGEIQFFSDVTSALDWLTNSSGRGPELELEWLEENGAELEKLNNPAAGKMTASASQLTDTF